MPDSTHGYDVTDHSRIREEFGGAEGLRAMAAALAEHGLGIVVDIVPNHMTVPVPESGNAQLWSVLAEGPPRRTPRGSTSSGRTGKSTCR
nr:hypothetical protein GCM10020093_096450 [Planobispora longispora]